MLSPKRNKLGQHCGRWSWWCSHQLHQTSVGEVRVSESGYSRQEL